MGGLEAGISGSTIGAAGGVDARAVGEADAEDAFVSSGSAGAGGGVRRTSCAATTMGNSSIGGNPRRSSTTALDWN